MKNPAGQECPYFYGDYYRGREVETCRLLPPGDWQPDLCAACPVPGIRRANACKHMVLNAAVRRRWRRGFKKQVVVSAWCEKTQQAVAEPQVGCGQCHPLAEIFVAEE